VCLFGRFFCRIFVYDVRNSTLQTFFVCFSRGALLWVSFVCVFGRSFY